MRSGRLVLVLVVLCLGAPATSHAYEEEVLRGIKGMCVAVAPISIEMEKLGLSASEMEKDVELHLRQAKIKVLRPKNLYREEGCSGLMIRVNGSITRVGRKRLVAYDIHLAVMELVLLRRPTLVPIIPAQTWGYESELMFADASRMAQVHKNVIELVDKFIRDYQEANRQ
ncbi:MAG: hypothetical protein P8X65_09600 [Syntrophobacterales bacterium]